MNEVGILYDKLFTLLFTNKSKAVHYGFWRMGVFTFAGAQENENVFLAEAVGVTAGQKILDAGCGVGGSAIWLAKKFSARVTGIAVGSREIAYAKKLARKKKLADTVDFAVMDMSKTTFTDETFNIIWAIESTLYVSGKKALLDEYARILSQNGKIVIADLFLPRSLNQKEGRLHHKFSMHSYTAPLTTISEMQSFLTEAGFVDIQYHDKRSAVYLTSLLYWLNALFLYPLVLVVNLLTFGLLPKWLVNYVYMSMEQWTAMRTGIFTYGVFVARKGK